MIVPLLAFAMIQNQALDQYHGSALLLSCKEAVRLQDSPEMVNDAGARMAAGCTDYLMGVAETGVVGHLFCIGTSTPIVLARTYVAYMERHPEWKDSVRNNGAILAFREAYPCSGQ